MEQCAEPACIEIAAVTIDGQLPPEDLAAYLDGKLTGKELERVEAVLARSREAREELVEASQLIATMPASQSRLRRPMILVSAVAAAAVLTIIVVPSRARDRGGEPIASERPARVDDGTRIRTILPGDGAVVGTTGVRFSWRAVPGATYQLTVTDAQGHTIWQSSTSDTTLILPDGVTLNGPATYYWSVDALAPDGSSTTTGIREMKVAAR